jgi:hypothetical protein
MPVCFYCGPDERQFRAIRMQIKRLAGWWEKHVEAGAFHLQPVLPKLDA